MTSLGETHAPTALTGEPPALEVRNISKHFGTTHALDAVSMHVKRGEVLGLLGQNGSGKSTLVGVLAGYHLPQRGGEILVDGREVDFPVVRSDHGLSFVFQDLGLVEDLTVLENLRMWRWSDPRAGRWYINRRSEAREAQEMLRHYGVTLPLHQNVGRLSLLDQALLAIVRSAEELRRFAAEKVTEGGGILVLDEPTVFLPSEEKAFLFELIQRVAGGGAGVILVSHDLHAIRQVADRVTVLRDGRVVGDAPVASSSEADLAAMILGTALKPTGPRAPATTVADAPERRSSVLEVRDLQGGRIRGIDLRVHAGEIVGLAGLVGSGAEDIPYLLLGALEGASGEVVLDGRPVQAEHLDPTSAIEAGLAVVPADRKRDGLVEVFAIWENAQMLVLRGHFRGGWLRRERAVRRAEEQCRAFRVKPPNPRAAVGSLSGGNQQKVLLSKWLETGPRVLVLHEPTQGVDLGARAEIIQTLKERQADGIGVLWVTSDAEEMAAVSDRVIVMVDGVVTEELVASAITKEAIDAATLRSRPEGAGMAREEMAVEDVR